MAFWVSCQDSWMSGRQIVKGGVSAVAVYVKSLFCDKNFVNSYPSLMFGLEHVNRHKWNYLNSEHCSMMLAVTTPAQAHMRDAGMAKSTLVWRHLA